MAILRASQLREKSGEELDTDLGELKKTLMKIRGGLASGGIPEDVGKTRELKKTISRILTIKRERELKPDKTAIIRETEKEVAAEKPVESKEKTVESKTKKTKTNVKKKQKEVIKKK